MAECRLKLSATGRSRLLAESSTGARSQTRGDRRMDGRKSFLLSIVALALAGCQTTGGDVAPQNFGGFSASSCQSGSNKCVVTISVAAGKSCTDSANITISPDVLEMKGRKGPIVWVFADKDYEFCPTKGDGVYIQS